MWGGRTPFRTEVPPTTPPAEATLLHTPARPSLSSNATTNPYTTLPPGWATAISPTDGQLYYYNSTTGQTSWVHPTVLYSEGAQGRGDPDGTDGRGRLPPAPPPPATTTTTGSVSWFPSMRGGSNRNNKNADATPMDYQLQQDNHKNGVHADTPQNASRRPDSQQCSAVVALLLCFPIGILALWHSLAVDSCWNNHQYGDAYNHARQAAHYAKFATWIGIFFWIWFLLIRRESRIVEWINFDLNFD